MNEHNDLLKEKIEYRTWLGRLEGHNLRALAAGVGLRDWLSMNSEQLIESLREHGKAQTVWAKEHGVFDGEETRNDAPGEDN